MDRVYGRLHVRSDVYCFPNSISLIVDGGEIIRRKNVGLSPPVILILLGVLSTAAILVSLSWYNGGY